MNITSNALASLKSASAMVWPSTFGSEKSGACVPRGNIVLGVLAMVGIAVGGAEGDSDQATNGMLAPLQTFLKVAPGLLPLPSGEGRGEGGARQFPRQAPFTEDGLPRRLPVP